MNDNLTEIAFILDRSGSMQSMVEPAISGFNRKMKALRRMKQGLADANTIRDAHAPMNSLREEEEGKDD